MYKSQAAKVLIAANWALDDIITLVTAQKADILQKKRTFGLSACNRFRLLYLFVSLAAFALFAFQAQILIGRHNEQVFFSSQTTSSPEFLQWPKLEVQMKILEM